MGHRNSFFKLKQHRPRLLGLALLALPSGLALAGDEVYTWKDATGRVHYGNRPPEGQAVTPIPVQPTDRIYPGPMLKARFTMAPTRRRTFRPRNSRKTMARCPPFTPVNCALANNSSCRNGGGGN